jgi:hypothetical protein
MELLGLVRPFEGHTIAADHEVMNSSLRKIPASWIRKKVPGLGINAREMNQFTLDVGTLLAAM